MFGVSSAARGDVELEQASFIVTFAEGTNVQDLATATGGTVIHTYKTFNGASIVINLGSLDALAGVSGIENIYLDEWVCNPYLEIILPGAKKHNLWQR